MHSRFLFSTLSIYKPLHFLSNCKVASSQRCSRQWSGAASRPSAAPRWCPSRSSCRRRKAWGRSTAKPQRRRSASPRRWGWGSRVLPREFLHRLLPSWTSVNDYWVKVLELWLDHREMSLVWIEEADVRCFLFLDNTIKRERKKRFKLPIVDTKIGQ